MVINGREIRFRRTVWGNCKIAEMCPKKDINKLSDLFKSDYATSQTTAARFICILSESWEKAHKYFDDPEYTPRPLTEDEVLMLDDSTFQALFTEALNAWADDGKTTVETAPEKKSTGGAE